MGAKYHEIRMHFGEKKMEMRCNISLKHESLHICMKFVERFGELQSFWLLLQNQKRERKKSKITSWQNIKTCSSFCNFKVIVLDKLASSHVSRKMIIFDILKYYAVKFWPWFYQWKHKVMTREFYTEKIFQLWWNVKRQSFFTQFLLLLLALFALFALISKVYAKFTKARCKSTAKLVGKTALITGANSGTNCK